MMTQMRSYDNVLTVMGTLATLLVLKTSLKIDTGRENGVRLKKMLMAMTFEGKTAGEGPLLYGLCLSDLSPTEIQEALNADPQKPDDVPASEQVMRKLMVIGVIPAAMTASTDPEVYREVRFPWKEIEEGSGLSWWVQNRDGGSLTTGTNVRFSSFAMGEWLDD